MPDLPDLLKALPTKTVEEAYSDGVKETLKEVSKLGVDALKTIRLALFPLQFASALQDRLAAYILSAVHKVPADRRITPAEPLALQIADKLRTQDVGGVITEMYISLLARAMDRDRVGEAHPAFIHIISQLAPDEALLIEQLSGAGGSAYMRLLSSTEPVLKHRRAEIIGGAPMNTNKKLTLINMMVCPEELQQPLLVYTYIEHLVSLGIVVYDNDPWSRHDFRGDVLDPYQFWFIRLNEFGRLFRSACLSGSA